MGKITLAVPYIEREQVKKLGARWDKTLKRWYISSDVDVAPFSAWLPQNNPESKSRLGGRWVLLSAFCTCWRCHTETPVFALAASQLEPEDSLPKRGFYIVYYATLLPEKLTDILRDKCCTYTYDFSQSEQQSYFINHCLCGATLAEYLIHENRGGPFVPRSEQQISNISILPLNFHETITLPCRYHNKIKIKRHGKWLATIRK